MLNIDKITEIYCLADDFCKEFEKAKAGHVYLRKTIVLGDVPVDATAAVICDNSFTLFVNGEKVGSGNDFKEASVFDLRPHLKPGTNLFAIDAVNHLPNNSLPAATEPPPGTENPAGLLFYARLRTRAPGVAGHAATHDFASDSSWLCSNIKQSGWEGPDYRPNDWAPAVELGDMGMVPWRVNKSYLAGKIGAAYPGKYRAALVAADPLMVALARPNREQVVTTRASVATTLQALELTNGDTLADVLKRGADNLLAAPPATPKEDLIATLYEKALGRKPTGQERQLAREMVGQPLQSAGLEDLLWSMAMLPEFQLIY